LSCSIDHGFDEVHIKRCLSVHTAKTPRKWLCILEHRKGVPCCATRLRPSPTVTEKAADPTSNDESACTAMETRGPWNTQRPSALGTLTPK
jgi:hypothetical protein